MSATPAFVTQPALRIRKGETFSRVIRWEVGPTIYKNITGATKAGPCVLTVASHGLPDGWRVKRIVSVAGMKQLNTHKVVAGAWVETPLGEDFPQGLKATVTDANTIELNQVNASGFDTYTSGGVIECNTPKDLTGYTARMQIRASADADTVLFELTTENSRIVLDNTAKTIELTIPVALVDEIDWTSGVATLEMVADDGTVTLLIPNWPVLVGETNVTRT
jgi:hypothetical protein